MMTSIAITCNGSRFPEKQLLSVGNSENLFSNMSFTTTSSPMFQKQLTNAPAVVRRLLSGHTRTQQTWQKSWHLNDAALP